MTDMLTLLRLFKTMNVKKIMEDFWKPSKNLIPLKRAGLHGTD